MSPLNPDVLKADACWETVCQRSDLVADSGVVVWLRGRQVALFYVQQGQEGERVFAIDNCDPQSGANVIGRGLLGSLAGRPVVAAPLYKQHFRLEDGVCLEAPQHRLDVWAARLRGDCVEVSGLE